MTVNPQLIGFSEISEDRNKTFWQVNYYCLFSKMHTIVLVACFQVEGNS